MSQAAIRTALNTAVNTVADVGNVHDYERWSDDWANFLDMFKTTINNVEQIRGWDIAYRGFLAERDPQFTRSVIHRHAFWIQGYIRLNDEMASEKEAAALAEAVCTAVDSNATLHTTVYQNTGPASMEEFTPRTFGGVLCHYAKIVVVVPEQVS
jgi:hypothetical protein